METESDDSERWEDFFGSSTDLAPSLLGIYDQYSNVLDYGKNGNSTSATADATNKTESNTKTSPLPYWTNSLDSKFIVNGNRQIAAKTFQQKIIEKHNADQHGDDLRIQLQSKHLGSLENVDTKSVSNSSNSSFTGSQESVASSNGTLGRSRTNFGVLSPNVQRIIQHSDAEPVEAVNIEALKQCPQAYTHSSPALSTVHRKCTALQSGSHHKPKPFNIHLSKIAGKLTQSGTDIVETFDPGSSDYPICRNPITPAISLMPSVLDDEKTPTNKNNPIFNFDNLKRSHILSLPSKGSAEYYDAVSLNSCSSLSFPFTSAENAFEAIEHELKNLTLDLEEQANKGAKFQELNETINKPLISKALVRQKVELFSNSNSAAAAAAHHPYVRSESLTVKETKTITTTHAAESDEHDGGNLSTENFDRLAEINVKSQQQPTKDLIRISSNSLQVSTDATKLKHRPLSSLSICSTSSSSSSGSGMDHHINGKMNISYLASVESLADPSENEQRDPHLGMTVFERACLEIVESEKSYVNDLEEVIRGYLKDWKERACLKNEDLKVLFSNIQEVYDFNFELLQNLVQAGMDPIQIAKCFIEMKDRFNAYTTYCTSYPEAISLLTKLLQATHTNALLAATQKMLHHTLPLGSYLLKPVQRILKYHLLLDNLRKHCDTKEVMQAYEIMRQVASNINQVKRKLEQQTRVKELCGILDGWLGPELTVLGELRLEGVLMEHNKPRRVLLFATMLIIAKAKEDNRLQFKSYIHQNNLMLNEHLNGEPTSFYVTPFDEPRHQIKLTAKNRDQKRQWTHHIKSVLLEKFDNIPMRAKELVYKLGDEEDKITDKNTRRWGLSSTSSTPTYLERRNQFRRSEIRSRSKIKRKTISNTTTVFDLYNNTGDGGGSQDNAANLKHISKSVESLNSSGNAMDSSAEVYEKEEEEERLSKDDKEPTESRTRFVRQTRKTFSFSGNKPLKERSKSVPRISSLLKSNSNEEDLQVATPEKNEKPAAEQPVCSKALPRLRVSLRKSKSQKKETSKFYMALSDVDDDKEAAMNVLKITESTENILVEKQKDSETKEAASEKPSETEVLTPQAKAKQDSEIVLELLRNSKEYDRLCSKLQKKQRSISTPCPKMLEGRKDFKSLEMPPRPPSRSPPPLGADNDDDCDIRPLNNAAAIEEPIYETLLRNVHVPYKFSPVLGRANSMQYYKARAKIPSPSHSPPRPESDYVTLVYSKEGILKNVVDTDDDDDDQHEPKSIKSEPDLSQDNSSNTSSTITLTKESQFPELIDKSCNHIYSSLNVMSSSYTAPTEMTSSKTQLSNRGILKRLWNSSSIAMLDSSEHRNSSSLDRHSIIHLQGSEAVGERIAHVDYADPRTLFSLTNSCNALQRDSVLSLSSSNDSVCETTLPHNPAANLKQNFAYEDSVEECLENDFRDSAIYSGDDNDRRMESSKASLSSASFRSTDSYPPVKPKPKNVPPSPFDRLSQNSSFRKSTGNNSNSLPGVIICPPHMNAADTRRWVRQQIDKYKN